MHKLNCGTGLGRAVGIASIDFHCVCEEIGTRDAELVIRLPILH